jgi:hypothetical protein
MRILPITILLPVGVWLLLAACNGGEGDDPAGSPAPDATAGPDGDGVAGLDACQLLRPADLEPLVGEAPEPRPLEAGDFLTCSYYPQNVAGTVQVQVCDCLSLDAFEAAVKENAAFLEAEAQPMQGLGDQAYMVDSNVWVQTGDITVRIRIAYRDGTPPDAAGDLRALTETVLGRLP